MPQLGASQTPGSVDADLLQQLRILKAAGDAVYRNPLVSFGNLRPRRVVMDGDSITAQGYGEGIDGGGWPYKFYNARGWWVYVLAILGGQVQVANMSAIQAQNAQEILARFETSVAAFMPDEVWAIIGQNNVGDADGGVAGAAAIRQYAVSCAKLGIKLRLGTVTPRQGASQSVTVRQPLVTLNAEIYKLQAEGLCVVFDSYGALVDPTQSNGSSLSNVFYDAMLHPNFLGAVRIALEFVRTFRNDFPPLMSLANSGDDDSLQIRTQSRQCLLNPNLRGTAGTLGTGASGTVPNDWLASRNSGTAISAVVAGGVSEQSLPVPVTTTAGATYTAAEQSMVNNLATQLNAMVQAYWGNSGHTGRNWTTMVLSGTEAGASAFQLQQASVLLSSMLVPIVPGRSTVFGRCTVRATNLPANFRGVELRLEGVNAGGTPTFNASGMATSTVADLNPQWPAQEMTLFTPSFVVPESTFRFRFSILAIYGNGTISGAVAFAQPQIQVVI